MRPTADLIISERKQDHFNPQECKKTCFCVCSPHSLLKEYMLHNGENVSRVESGRESNRIVIDNDANMCICAIHSRQKLIIQIRASKKQKQNKTGYNIPSLNLEISSLIKTVLGGYKLCLKCKCTYATKVHRYSTVQIHTTYSIKLAP